eukprot:CAMPEP_0198541886 /NCGR_PEP_ID=MMETSP1462-20131121/55441_1 /TAXON_ID=1333877 /ORGANISM="Brandtodinium nutriculum, Strain RCC3387" /LENGTH=75 /DNA_ID=CAMNT_0044272075 /DNA_START=18 /DNA_END=242 /DNA_ORIENTATION=+
MHFHSSRWQLLQQATVLRMRRPPRRMQKQPRPIGEANSRRCTHGAMSQSGAPLAVLHQPLFQAVYLGGENETAET